MTVPRAATRCLLLAAGVAIGTPANAVDPCGTTAAALVGTHLGFAPLSSFDGIETGEGDGLYVTPSAAAVMAVAEGTRLLATGALDQAAVELAQGGYHLCRGQANESSALTVLVAYDAGALSRASSRGAAVAVFRDEPIHEGHWAVLAPHAVTETNVAALALELLESPGLPAFGVVVGAVHRCNRLDLAPVVYQAQTGHCDGAFRVSDMAHNDDSFFHAFHAGMQQASAGVGTLQLHGMGTPGASISHGRAGDTAAYPADLVAAWHVTLREELARIGVPGAEVTACSIHAGPGGAAWRDLLCGTRSAATASADAHGNAQRNIHLELGAQARQNAANRNAVALSWRRALEQLQRDGFEAGATQ